MAEFPSQIPLTPWQSLAQKRVQRLAKQLGWKVEFQGRKARLMFRSKPIMNFTSLDKVLQRLRAEMVSRQREAGADM